LKILNWTKKLIAISSLIIAVIFISACSAGGGADFTAEAPAAAAPAAADAPRMAQRQSERMEFAAMEVAEEAEFFFDSDDDWAFYGAEDGTVGLNLSFGSQMLERMVVRNSSLTIETTQFDYVVHEVDRIISRYGGFVESSNQWLSRRARRDEDFWNASYTLRIPVDNFDAANRDLQALGYLVDFSTFSEDVTMRFADMESRLQIRLEEERRILEMIETTDDLSDLIRLEARLADLLIAIDMHRRSMTELDMLASFSTINLFISEVEEEGAAIAYVDNFGGRISEAFAGSVEISVLILEGLAIMIATIILPLAIMGLIVFGIFLLVRRAVRPKV